MTYHDKFFWGTKLSFQCFKLTDFVLIAQTIIRVQFFSKFINEREKERKKERKKERTKERKKER